MLSAEELRGLGLVLLWFLIYGADVVWTYFYVYASLYPNPRIAVNITESAWTGYTFMMHFFNFWWGLLNGIIWMFILAMSRDVDGFFLTVFMWIIVGPIAVILTLGPFISLWVALPLAHQVKESLPFMISMRSKITIDSVGCLGPRV